MKVRLFGILMICSIAVTGTVWSKPFGPPGGPCTNYGWKYLYQMSQVGANYSQGCVSFEFSTGRKVRNRSGIQGGDPSTLPGTQLISYTYFSSCMVCTPPPLNSMAVEGQELWEEGSLGSFGRYDCEGILDPNPDANPTFNPPGPPGGPP